MAAAGRSLVADAVLRPSGEAAVVVEFGDRVDPVLHDRVLALDHAVRTAPPPGVVECVPSYRSLLVRFDPFVTSAREVWRALDGLAPVPRPTGGQQHEVVVRFGGDAGPDLPGVADQLGLEPEEVVHRLCAGPLRLYLHGFAPGFAYLGGVPDELHLPRRASPRAPVPAGSVLLAAGQAALCPVPMPTGWWVVGHTDVPLFDSDRDPPVPMEPGDAVRLVPA